MRIATFMHISDLHIGDLDPNSEDASLDAVPPLWWPRMRWFDGYLGHSGRALSHLVDVHRELKSDENATLLITGDVTAVGSRTEFALARGYLETKTTLSSGITIGLGESGVLRNRAVPGNHDHWPGRRATVLKPLAMFGRPTKGLAATFPGVTTPPWLPIQLWRHSLPKGPTVVIAGINTDADVHPLAPSPSRLYARGKFRSQLVELEKLWTPVNRDEIRVLLLHHSPLHPDWVLGINSKSARDLTRVIERCEISVLLTGHAHIAAARALATSHGSVTWDLWEARSGTTTQRDTMPTAWSAGANPLVPNTLLVHRLYREEDDAPIEWQTELYERSSRGFVLRRPVPAQGRLPGQGVIVWPRT